MVEEHTAAGIAGKMDTLKQNSFMLQEPNIQVFEKKPKEQKETAFPVARIGRHSSW